MSEGNIKKLGADYENHWTHQEIINKINEIIDYVNQKGNEIEESREDG